MSQKSEKLRRQVEAPKGRMDFMESNAAWYAAERDVHNRAILDATAERNAEHRRAKRAERAVHTWRNIAYAAMVTAIIVEIVAICAIRAAGADTSSTPPVTASAPEVTTISSICAAPEEPKIDAADAVLPADKLRVIENATVTHYCICEKCCGKTPDHPAYGITASGRAAVPGTTVAVDPNVIPMGAEVLVDYGDGELHRYRADDTGGAVKGNHIDLCVAAHEEALQLGRRTATVYWVAPEEVA